MSYRAKAIFNWSGGKDSALCLYKVQQSGSFDLSYLLTSVNEKYSRVSMHGVRQQLLRLQAQSLQLPLVELMLPEMPDMTTYEQRMRETLEVAAGEGISYSIFGDIFLEDLKKYREDKLKEVNMTGVFPLWKKDTRELIREFIDLGFKAVLVCINEKYLDKSFAGRIIDPELLKDLPKGVDPCGENGEYHSFVFDGPNFASPIPFTIGETVYRKYEPVKSDNSNSYTCGNEKEDDPFNTGFWYTDLVEL